MKEFTDAFQHLHQKLNIKFYMKSKKNFFKNPDFFPESYSFLFH